MYNNINFQNKSKLFIKYIYKISFYVIFFNNHIIKKLFNSIIYSLFIIIYIFLKIIYKFKLIYIYYYINFMIHETYKLRLCYFMNCCI